MEGEKDRLMELSPDSLGTSLKPRLLLGAQMELFGRGGYPVIDQYVAFVMPESPKSRKAVSVLLQRLRELVPAVAGFTPEPHGRTDQ